MDRDQTKRLAIAAAVIGALFAGQLLMARLATKQMSYSEFRIAVLLGGRAAEAIVFGDKSTGAEDDLLKATQIARTMVRAYGMSARLGTVSFEAGRHATLLGPASEIGARDFSDETARAIDDEIRRVLEGDELRVLVAGAATERAA